MNTRSEALDLLKFRSALEYLVPLLQWERNPKKRATLKDKIDVYIARFSNII